MLGTVCYDPAVPSIWKGMMRHFAREGLDVDFVSFTSYERLNDALLRNHVHIAWNGPLAHARLLRVAAARSLRVVPLGMRDCDRDFGSLIVARADARVASLADVAHRRVAVGTVDSPQAYVLPLWHLQRSGVDLGSLSVTRFDRDIGKHGDTALGEDAVLDALASGAVEVGAVSRLVWDRALAGGRAAGLVVVDAVPPFDHCQFAGLHGRSSRFNRFSRALLAQRRDGTGAHAEDARTMELEGIRERWVKPRGGVGCNAKAGYEAISDALDAWGEPRYLFPGVLHTAKKHPFKHLTIDYRLIRDANGC